MSEMTGNTALLAQVCGAGGPVLGAPAWRFQPLSSRLHGSRPWAPAARGPRPGLASSLGEGPRVAYKHHWGVLFSGDELQPDRPAPDSAVERGWR